MKQYTEIVILAFVVISFSCDRMKQKMEEIADKVKKKSKSEIEAQTQKVVNKVFPQFDHSKPDTENNKKRSIKHYLSKQELKEVYKLSLNYFLLKEKTWKRLIENIKKDNDDELIIRLDSWKNPSRVRPFYLLKSK